MHIGIVHTLGGGIVSAVDERIAWLNGQDQHTRATLVAPYKRSRTLEPTGVFFPVDGNLPGTYQQDYERAVVSKLVPALMEAHAADRFDVLDAQDGAALIGCLNFCERTGVPLMHTIHSHEIVERFSEGPSEELRHAIRGTSTFIAVSDCVGQAHAAILPRIPITVRNPVPRGVLKRRPPLDQSSVRAVFLGRIEVQKGFDVLLDASEYLEGKSKLTVSALGSIEDENLGARAKASAVPISLCGKIDNREELFARLSDHDLLVFPSRKEACSMALLEAMGTGLAVLCSDIPPNVEIAGDGARYHKVGDAGSLAEHLQELLDSPHLLKEHANKAATRARAFAPEVVFKSLVHIYEGLV